MSPDGYFMARSIFDFEENGEMCEALYVPHVCIIESPSKDDRAIGRREGAALSSALELAGIRHKLFDVFGLKSLRSALVEMAEFCQPHLATTNEVKADKKQVAFPRLFVHFSCHGNSDGIGLTDGEFIPWTDLGQLLMKFASDLGAIEPGQPVAPMHVCMSSCCGLYGRKMASPEACPFICLIGCKESVDWTDALTAYITFYHQVINKERIIPRAVTSINEASLQRDVFELVMCGDIGVSGFTSNPVVVLMCADPDGRFIWVFDQRRGRPEIPVTWPKDDLRDLVTGEPLIESSTGKPFPYFDDHAAAVNFMRGYPGRFCQVERGAAQEICIREA